MKSHIKGIFILFLSLLPLKAQQLVDGVAAIVGEEIILYSDVQQLTIEMIRYSGRDLSTITEKDYLALQNEALRELINMEVILLQAEEDSIIVQEREIETAINQQIQQYLEIFGSEEQIEQAFNLTMRKIREFLYDRVKSSLIIQQIQNERFGNIVVSRPEVIMFYNEHKDSIPDIPERVDISHILMIPTPSEEKKEKKRQELLVLREKILSGKISFHDAALNYSSDRASAVQGGQLGFSPKGTFVPSFEKTAFSLKEGEISDIVETQFGLHLIKLTERRGELINPAHILFEITVDEEDISQTKHMLSTIRDSILAGGDFETFALKYSDDPDVTKNKGNLGEFSLNTLQIEEFKSVLDTLEEGEISGPFQTSFGLHILKLNKRKPAEKISLETHYNIVENMAISYKKQDAWNRWLDSLYEKFYVEIKQ
ncbi:MAG: peptidylprolyl isomerase [Candidatus Marinimicrobia bacterium]|nr:peptidylprolyl isomerase [Candidatus Neomarinimicrobiota bacterium]MDD5582774.1 peptidylprolyl isomerase [Candidatus Neomarinimicrobiota bacterium]